MNTVGGLPSMGVEGFMVGREVWLEDLEMCCRWFL